MYLTKLLIVNYRSCKCVEIDLLKDEPNILIGINDCGKTSLLKGLELMLAEKPQIFYVKDEAKKKDASNSMLPIEDFQQKCKGLSIPVPPYTASEILVLGKFFVEEEDFTDSDVQQLKAHSLWALENSNDGIWYCRSFDQGGKQKHFLLVPDIEIESGEYESFFNLTAAQLTKKRNEHELSADEITNSNGVGRFSNLEIIRALYTKLGTTKFWTEWKWEKSLLPSFRYLDWNSSFDNILESATEALKELIDDHLNPVKVKAREGAQAAQNALNEKLHEQRNVIASILPQVQRLSANIHFDVKEKITDLLITKIGSDDAVHMDLQGDGIKRQIWFALIKAATVKSEASSRKKHIWAFDEPETHLYPTAQRQLFEIIKEVSSASIQTLISTHSTVFIDRANLSAIKIISQSENYTTHSTCSSIDEIFHSLDLRNSDFLFYDSFLLVEGETEEHLIPSLYKIYTGNTLIEDSIQLIPLGGASKWLERKRALDSVFEGFKKSTDKVIYLMDNDQKFNIGTSSRPLNKFFFVGRQDIEDAIDSEIWSLIIDTYTGRISVSPDNIETIKKNIVSTNSISDHDKFLKILSKHIKGLIRSNEPDYNESPLPDKGKDLAEQILKHLKTKDQIPEEIRKCFDAIKPIVTINQPQTEKIEESV